MNKHVSVSAREASIERLGPGDLESHNVVIVAGGRAPLKEQMRLDEMCRAKGVAFFAGTRVLNRPFNVSLADTSEIVSSIILFFYRPKSPSYFAVFPADVMGYDGLIFVDLGDAHTYRTESVQNDTKRYKKGLANTKKCHSPTNGT